MKVSLRPNERASDEAFDEWSEHRRLAVTIGVASENMRNDIGIARHKLDIAL